MKLACLAVTRGTALAWPPKENIVYSLWWKRQVSRAGVLCETIAEFHSSHRLAWDIQDRISHT